MKTEFCPLCESNAEDFFSIGSKSYYLCSNCKAIFVDSRFLPGTEAERVRYNEHNNDVNDSGYRKFVSPIVNSVLRDFHSSSAGLDFGAGPGPVISLMLSESGYRISQYDPFFHPSKELLKSKYDYIVCCEVIEHFHHPAREFQILRNLLLPLGKLYCMTSIYSDSIDFANWYYKNDLTHVIFYQVETLNFICRQFGFLNVKIENNLITFSV